MADLMSGSYTFAQLQQKYANFLAPAAKVKIDGTDIASAWGLAVDDLNITVSLEEAGSCNFTVVNAYDLQKRQFKDDCKNNLIPGAVIEVSLGYGSDLTLVFKGYISEVSVAFGEMPTYSCTAMDVRRLMMDGGDTYLIHQVKSYSAAFWEVMERYAKLTPQKEVDDTPDQFEQLAQMNNDYQFVTMVLCKNGDREFFVIGGKAYFRKPQKVAVPIVTLEWGRDLLSFSRNSMYQDFEVQVVGYDDENKEVIQGEAREKNDEKQSQVISEVQATLKADPSIKDLQAANEAAKKEAEERKKRAQSGSAVCIGLPEIVPGRFIKLEKLDSMLDKKYYVNKVQHAFGSDGFTTNIEIKGW